MRARARTQVDSKVVDLINKQFVSQRCRRRSECLSVRTLSSCTVELVACKRRTFYWHLRQHKQPAASGPQFLGLFTHLFGILMLKPEKKILDYKEKPSEDFTFCCTTLGAGIQLPVPSRQQTLGHLFLFYFFYLRKTFLKIN